MRPPALLRALCMAVIVMLFAFSPPGIAQTYTLSGSLTDTLNKAPLPYASVVLVRVSDSMIQAFTRAKEDGSFTLRNVGQDKYRLLITFPNFADYVDVLNIKDLAKKGDNIDLGAIAMISKTLLLKEFVLTQQVAAIKIKGDTTEYMADSFRVKENATVEDLLKRLPGIQVDKNGQVTAQGETVQKILVDGEEFFSDDPKVVTRGLQADAVEKVQVFDKKSDQADFTGIDDGQKSKTINLQLKEDRKKGYFGKLDAGGGTDGYFQDQGMINAFKGKRQLSAFGIMSNTDQVGLGWEDRGKYSSSNNTIITDDGGDMVTYYNNSNDFESGDGRYTGQGLPKVWTGGIHFADKWNEDKDHVTGNYRYAMQNIELSSNTLTQNTLPSSQYFSNEHKDQFNKTERHGVDGMYEWKIDSNSSIKLNVDADDKKNETYSAYNTDILDSSMSLVNHTFRKIISTNITKSVNSDLLFRKKFAKKGRTLSIDMKENYKDLSSNGTLNSDSKVFAGPGTVDSTTNQRKENGTHTLAFAAKATYTEPLSKTLFLEFSYGLALNNSTAVYNSYNIDNGVPGGLLDSLYSSNYTYNILTNTGGLSMRYVFKKLNFSIGTGVSDSRYKQQDLYRDTTYNYDYLNLTPNANLTYKVGKQTSVSISYLGSTRQPTIEQIQPLRQNTDPLNITAGNPALKREFRHSINAHYNDYKVLSSRYLWAGLGLVFVQDAISANQTLTNDGVRQTQYINVNGDYNGWAYVGYGFNIKKLDLNLGAHINPGVNHVNSVINGQQNVSDNNTYQLAIDANYNKEEKYSFYLEPSVTYNDNRSSISKYTTSYWSGDLDFNGSVELPLKFEAGSTVNITLREKTVVFTQNNDVVKWNAFVSKKFLKKGQLVLRAEVFDILNQNLGIMRQAQDNMLTNQNYNTIRRHSMLSLIWNFTHTPAGAPAPPAGGMMMR